MSVIITTYNRSTYLYQSIRSIVEQTYTNIEILIIDDGSDFDIAKENKHISNSFSKCRYYFKPNTGQPDSRNFGIKMAKGKYIAFNDDDDYWLEDKLEKQVGILEKYPEVGLVTGNVEFVNADGYRSGRIIRQSKNHGYVFEDFLLKNRTSSITPLLRNDVFNKVGYFNTKFDVHEDWEFWIRVAYYYPFHALEDVLACVRRHDDNMTKILSNNPIEQYCRYKKVIRSIQNWGKSRFTKQDFAIIKAIEAKRYDQILKNHCPGIFNKLKFIAKVFQRDVFEGASLFVLFVKHQLI